MHTYMTENIHEEEEEEERGTEFNVCQRVSDSPTRRDEEKVEEKE